MKHFMKFDNKSHTVIIIKFKDSNEILGGYNPIEWKSDNSYGVTKDSLYSFSRRVMTLRIIF
jgi:hypothetical protein